jgi:hypothetical protein
MVNPHFFAMFSIYFCVEDMVGDGLWGRRCRSPCEVGDGSGERSACPSLVVDVELGDFCSSKISIFRKPMDYFTTATHGFRCLSGIELNMSRMASYLKSIANPRRISDLWAMMKKDKAKSFCSKSGLFACLRPQRRAGFSARGGG